jgi:phage/plasmid primase-like uncharacterized protein
LSTLKDLNLYEILYSKYRKSKYALDNIQRQQSKDNVATKKRDSRRKSNQSKDSKSKKGVQTPPEIVEDEEPINSFKITGIYPQQIKQK